MAKKKDTGPRIVVATAKGLYKGSTIRPGQRFAILSPEHFAEKWMIDPKEKPEEARKLEVQYKGNYGPRSRDVDDASILSELAAATGGSAVLRAEIVQLKGRIKELEEENAQLKAKPASVGETSESEGSDADDEDADDDADGDAETSPVDGGDDGDGDGADATGSTEEPQAAPTLRRRTRSTND